MLRPWLVHGDSSEAEIGCRADGLDFRTLQREQTVENGEVMETRVRRGLRSVGGLQGDIVLYLRGSLEYLIHNVIRVLTLRSSKTRLPPSRTVRRNSR